MKKRTAFLLALFLVDLVILLQLIIVKLGFRFNLSVDMMIKIQRKIASSFITIIVSVCIFYIFINLKPFSNKYINLLGKSTFGVYLLHDNAVLSIFMWNAVFHINNINSIFPVKKLFVPFIIFALASMIDIIFDFICEKICKV